MLVKHLYILLLVPLVFFTYHLAEPGISIAGGFPYLDTSHYAIHRLAMWVERGSIDGFEFLPRFPIMGLWHLLTFVNINSELNTKLMIVSGFALSSFSFYFSFLLFFRGKLTDSDLKLKLSSLVGSFFYAYNVWAFNRIHHWYLWLGYSVLPLFIVSIFFSFKNPKSWKHVLSCTFLWSLASVTQHMALFYGIILIAAMLIFILNSVIEKKKIRIQLGVSFFSIILFYSMVNMYWIYPYVLASNTQVLTPNYEVTEENLKLLSRESNFLNTLRVLDYWQNSDIDTYPEHSLQFYLWTFASFVVPVTAFSALFIKKSLKYALIFSSGALIAILFAMGTQAPVDYYKVALSVPILSKFIWIFRDPDKLSFLTTSAYSFLIAISNLKILSVITKEKNNDKKIFVLAGSFLLLLTGSIFLYSYPFYKYRMDQLHPILLPAEFDGLNEYLSTINDSRVLFIPHHLEAADWQRNDTVGDIYQMHSIKPSNEGADYSLDSNNYYNYIEDSIMQNRLKNISNLIYPLGTSYVIFHNDTWNELKSYYNQDDINFLKKLGMLEDVKDIHNIGFYKIFKTSNNNNNNNSAGQVNIPSQNIAVLGGLDVSTSLNVLPSFNSLKSSILFLDDIGTKNTNVPLNFDTLIFDRSSSEDELALSFVDNKYIIAPSDATDRHEPEKVWSKSGARDPTNAEFHPYLKNLGIENWNFDYGKGLAITKALNANLSIPVEIENQNKNNNDSKDDIFYLFMRYFKNQKGGPIKIYLDGKLINEVNTFDMISNNFVWEKIGSMNVTKQKEKHTLTLENVAGFNAVNIFAFVPHDEMNKLRTQTAHLLTDKIQVIYPMEAESNFYNNKGMHSGSFHNLFDNHSVVDASNNGTSTFTETLRGQFKVPSNTEFATLQFLVKQNPNTESSYSIKDLEIIPVYKKQNVFTSDFERKQVSAPLATLRQLDWMNYDKDLQSTSLESNNAIDGNTSLRVDAKQSNKVGWKSISTDFIPIDENAYYNATLDISAKDVKQLHSKIFYFDLKKKPVREDGDFIFEGKDGTFQGTFNSSILPPIGAKYLKIQIMTSSNNAKSSNYVLDNVKLEEIIDPDTSLKNTFDMENLGKDQNLMGVTKEDALREQFKKYNSTHYIIETKSLPIKGNHFYNYTMSLEAKNAYPLYGIVSFRNSSDVVMDSIKYGNNASNGAVLSLSNGSDVHTRLHIIQPSNYTVALRAKTCETCTFLTVSIVGLDKDGGEKNNNNNTKISNISLKDKNSGLKWLYSNSTYLKKGTYELRINSDSKTDLDSVVIYPIDNGNVSGNNRIHNESLEDLFNPQVSPPAQISGYKKINPTKHILNIKNATRPYMISFAESYDPLWRAYVNTDDNNSNNNGNKSNNFMTNSIPLYGVTNGFYVNKTGDYSLTIEYQPQKWFIQGATISIFSLVAILAGFLLLRKQKTIKKLYAAISSSIWHRTNKA
jgi:hypothetical protein